MRPAALQANKDYDPVKQAALPKMAAAHAKRIVPFYHGADNIMGKISNTLLQSPAALFVSAFGPSFNWNSCDHVEMAIAVRPEHQCLAIL
jgi:hypothetical protein